MVSLRYHKTNNRQPVHVITSLLPFLLLPRCILQSALTLMIEKCLTLLGVLVPLPEPDLTCGLDVDTSSANSGMASATDDPAASAFGAGVARPDGAGELEGGVEEV